MTSPILVDCCVCSARGYLLVGDEGQIPERKRCPACQGARRIDPLFEAAVRQTLAGMSTGSYYGGTA